MSNEQRDDYDDDVRNWLAPIGGPESPPDCEFLRGLRERSAEEFARSATQPPSVVRADAGLEGLTREKKMSGKRAFTVAAACAAALAVWFVGGWLPAAQGVTLGDALQKSAAAKSLKLQLRRDGKESEVLVAGDRARWDEAPERYTVIRGSQLWRVDEEANTAVRGAVSRAEAPSAAAAKAASQEEPAPVDLLALLETAGEFELDGVDQWLASTASGEDEYLGRRCLVFERVFTVDDRRLRLVGYVDAETQLFQGLIAWPVPARPTPVAELRVLARNVAVDEDKFVVAESLTEDGRIGKVADVQGLVAMQPPLAKRWTPVIGPVLLKPGDWVRTQTRGANAVRLVLSSQVELTLGPSALVELITPHRARVFSGEVQVKVPAAAEGGSAPESFTLLGKSDAVETIAAGQTTIFRRRDADADLAKIDAKPQWLAGFEGTTTNESLGSLIATVDGRSEPLSVGYHKVTVDIRDQIARTTIEESFVNHASGRLEGVFYFPLPADASISGFGMWIAGELVEADIVEKQRAREIYETILREKRDPGLLEWTSGNLFKARVFPIEAHSEKRIKLVYTQVLPLRNNRYVYSYGLRSELLRTRPLRELNLDVRISSELPLRSVTCPTHDVRSEQTAHAGHVQFTAEEYAPTRDFEVVCEIDGRQSDVVVIPHQRGEDGYFLVQLTPPGDDGAWRRETLGEGAPLNVLLVCDTSGSMDSECRRQQRAFVEATLTSLGPDDKFNLAVSDVDTAWAFDEESVSPSEQRIEQALKFLADRQSLGWTDLAKTFAAALDRAGPNTQVIYIGDGVPSAGDADPQTLVGELRRLDNERGRGVCHAVAVGNIVETTVLKSIASLGGGSQRTIGGEASPERIALELLQEVTSPGLRDLRVEFSGVQTAAVYPQQLPNLAAGSQQILVGRYLPQAGDQRGEITVTGRRGDEEVRYASGINFPATTHTGEPANSQTSGSLPLEGMGPTEHGQPEVARAQGGSLRAATGEGGEAGTSPDLGARGITPSPQGEGNRSISEGNSFIPRLWARQHLDNLLAQGGSAAIQDEIIALSEEFHIITPYTSLLVLESDADRERFGVKRRFLMRDGERFFAQGRDNANYELEQQQMRLASNWRQGLRQQVLAQLATLGRDPNVFQQGGDLAFPISVSDGSEVRKRRLNINSLGDLKRAESMSVSGRWFGLPATPASMPVSGRSGVFPNYTVDLDLPFRQGSFGFSLGFDRNGRGGGFGGGGSLPSPYHLSDDVEYYAPASELPSFDQISTGTTIAVPDGGTRLIGGLKRNAYDWSGEGEKSEASAGPVTDGPARWDFSTLEELSPRFDFGESSQPTPLGFQLSSPAPFFAGGKLSGNGTIVFRDGAQNGQQMAGELGGEFYASQTIGLQFSTMDRTRQPYGGYDYDSSQWLYEPSQWFDPIAPALPGAPPRVTPPQPNAEAGWNDEAIALADSLLRREAFAALEGGLEIHRTTEGFDPRWDRTTSRSERLELLSPKAWLTRPLGEGVHTIVEWCSAQERGIVSRAFALGRVRKSVERELQALPYGGGGELLRPLYQTYSYYNVRIERPAANRAVLVFSRAEEPGVELRLTIDAERHVLLEFQQKAEDKVQVTIAYEDFVEVGSAWWAQRATTRDSDGAIISRYTQTIQELDADAFAARMTQELPSRAASRGAPSPTSAPAPALLLQFPLPELQQAKERIAAGGGTVEDHLVLLADFVSRQQWDDATEQVEAMVRLAGGEGQVGAEGLPWLRMAIERLAGNNAVLLEKLRFHAARLPISQRADEWHVAHHLLGVASAIADANEQLRLLDQLKPVFDEQPEFVAGVASWQQRRVDLLRSLGRTEEMLPLHRTLAESVPWHVSRQTAYARDLYSAQRRDEAYAWLQQELDRNPRRSDSDKTQLVAAASDLLHEEGRYKDEADYLAERTKDLPSVQDVYWRYLSALVFADRLAQAEELVREWLVLGRSGADQRNGTGGEKLSPEDVARLQAAVSYAHGDRWNLNVYRFEEQWLAPLADAARRFALHPHHANIAQEILGDWRFSDTDEADGVRRDLFARLQAEVETLSPAQLGVLVTWTIGQTPTHDDAAWKAIAEAIRRRWDAAPDVQTKHALSGPLVSINSSRFADSEYLPFLRAQLDVSVEDADDAHRATYASQLFFALLTQTWTEQVEVEAFKLLRQLSTEREAEDKLFVEVPALYRLVDRMIEARRQKGHDELYATGHPEKLTRAELAAKEADFFKAAREGIADRLTADAGAMGDDAPLAHWFRLERMTLDVQLGRQLDVVAAECWDVLGDSPLPKTESEDANDAPEVADDDAADENAELAEADLEALRREITRATIDAIYRQRAFALVSYLATQRNANEELVTRTLKFVDAGIAQGLDAGIAQEDNTDGAEGDWVSQAWRSMKYQLLIALDRPDELETALREWIAVGGPVSPWRATLGRLLAERGQLKEAITVFETIRANDALAPSDLAALAQWYQAADRRDDYNKTMLEVYMMVEEWQLRQMIDGYIQPWQYSGMAVPTELDPQSLLVFEALFRKASNPGQYAWLLREYYAACRDFRLLRMVPDALLGRTAQQIYPFLTSLDGSLFGEVRDEAVADEILGRAQELQAGELSALDRRALDLLTAMIERRSSEVLNQPGPHAEAAVAALQRAMRDQWADGERLQMAQLLTNLGRITAPALAAEQVRGLRALLEQTEPATVERALIAGWLARALFTSHNEREQAFGVLETETSALLRARNGVWPEDAKGPLATYAELLQAANRHADAEAMLTRYAKAPASPQMEEWFSEQINEVHLAAFRADGRTSLGSGEELYANLLEQVTDELATGDPQHRDQQHRYELVVNALNLFYWANEKPATKARAQRDLQKFADETLPELLASQTVNTTNIISNAAGKLQDINGARAGLAFLIARLENYPPWLEMSYQNAWNEFGSELGQWREEVGGALGDLAPRLLELTLAELRRDLTLRDSRNRYVYSDYLWEEKKADFARLAQEILRQRRGSSRSVTYIAAYLWSPLNLVDQAIAAMMTAHRDGILDDNGQIQVVEYLHYAGRFGESIAILEGLLERDPARLHQRQQLMVAYHRTNRPEQVRELLKASDEYLREAGRWTEEAVAMLADACRATALNEEAVAYYLELIALVQRQQPGGGIGGELPNYYRGLAEVYAALKQTEKAVDAAAGAIVSWGPNYQRREEALATMRSVMNQSDDLGAFASTWARKAEETGEDSPLIRRMLGEVFLSKAQGQPVPPVEAAAKASLAEAATQLRAAIELEPTDLATHKLLVQCLDAQGKTAEAADALFAAIDVDRRNLELIGQLADKLASNEAQAERAVTMLVEASPQESEGHAALAERRQGQNRWADAIEQWQHVARIRSLEPEGLQKLLTAQIHERRWDDAEQTVGKLLQKRWPERFGDIPSQVAPLQQQITAGRDAE
jgi:tetratricopeptide (TPR) repeat protein